MTTQSSSNAVPVVPVAAVQAGTRDLALHTLGWKAFQDLCGQICGEVLRLTISVYREAQDGGQDATFLIDSGNGSTQDGTVQCKFTSNASRRLKASDLSGEEESIRDLVSRGKAHRYYFITNMGIDAPVAEAMRDRLREIGVADPYVLGKEWITLQISESARLRALVPRVYGLGDLSTILDERRAAQTSALLGHLMPSLKVYVPTSAHRTAVQILADKGIVLLLGAPATGKSMLAAILATTALDGEGHRCFQFDGPNEFVNNWNPNDNGRFYWIDDAFGPSQLRSDYVDTWIAIMNKVKAAVAAGNRLVLTSRVHIWNAAKGRLGTRNHPLFVSGDAVVNVGHLSPVERQQILYNHIKAGNQARNWKAAIKPHLPLVANDPDLLPEIARRLGDKGFTRGVTDFPEDIVNFVAYPMDFLVDSIQELSEAQRAALTLVFLHRSRLPFATSDGPDRSLVASKFGVSVVDLGDALEQLTGAFLVTRTDGNAKFWSFAHPTISDALSKILTQRPDLVELYVKGTKVETLLAEVVCEGAPAVRDAVVVPNSVSDLLVSRLVETPNEPDSNRALFGFLCDRASDAVLRAVLSLEAGLLNRQPAAYWRICTNSTVLLCARAHSLGILPEEKREEIASRLESALLIYRDASFLSDDKVLALIRPTKLLSISSELLGRVVDELPDEIVAMVDSAERDCEPGDVFSDLVSFVAALREAFPDNADLQEDLEVIDTDIASAVRTLEDRVRDPDVEWEGEDIAPAVIASAPDTRSIFSDVDE